VIHKLLLEKEWASGSAAAAAKFITSPLLGTRSKLFIF
jgi:hypothetical protein